MPLSLPKAAASAGQFVGFGWAARAGRANDQQPSTQLSGLGQRLSRR